MTSRMKFDHLHGSLRLRRKLSDMKYVGNLFRTGKRSFRCSCRVCHITVLLAAVEPLEARPSGSLKWCRSSLFWPCVSCAASISHGGSSGVIEKYPLNVPAQELPFCLEVYALLNRAASAL